MFLFSHTKVGLQPDYFDWFLKIQIHPDFAKEICMICFEKKKTLDYFRNGKFEKT